MQVQEALEFYVAQLEADGRSPHTIAQYRRHVGVLAGWLLAEVDHRVLAVFLADPAARSRPDGGAKKATSVNALRSTLRTFLGYLADAGFLTTNPARLLRRARCSPPPPKAMSDEEADKVLATLASADGRVAGRDHALVVLLLGAGLRLGAALGLDVEDIDLARGEARLRRDKGDRAEVIVLTEQVVEVLRAHVAERRSGPVFVGRTGERLSSRHAQRQFAGWLRKSGIERSLSPHSCRHAFATRLLARTGNIRLVQRALRHRSISSTAIYAATDDSEVRRALAMSERLPRSARSPTDER
jgi:integrase/recombinase XerC